MKYHPIVYWTSTILISAMMLFAAGVYLTHSPQVMATFAHLGYPAYFVTMLATAKILGVCALLIPRWPRLKEWAYAGFTFTFIAAFVSHLESGDGIKALIPVVALIIMTVSCLSRPASRTFPLTLPVSRGDWRPDFTKPVSNLPH